MSFLVYQRSDPRHKEWIPLMSQQVRLRNVIQIIGLNLEVESREDEVYFTLHTRAMSTPFFTSERLQTQRRVVTWKEIEPRQIPETIRLSAPGFIIRVWAVTRGGSGTLNTEDTLSKQQRPITSWGLYLGGLNYLGSKGDWNTKDFAPNTILFRMPFGFFTSLNSLVRRPVAAHRFLQVQVPSEQLRSSYTLKKLSSLHSIQRSVLEEVSLSQDLKSRICLYGYSQDVDPESSAHTPMIYGEKSLIRAKEGRIRLQLKEKIEGMRQRVSILRDEKVRRFGRVIQLKKDYYDSEDISMELMGRMQMLGREIERLKELKAAVQEKKINLSHLSAQLFRRKKELISELLVIYPLSLVEGSKKYSINEIQLPNAEDYSSESGGQISVALGYTAHLTAMISFFLGIPLRYPVRHFGSQSRIVDHITEQITDKEREFPLYFRNKEDVYSKYAVYLLNKNIAQLRWYCGLSTPELRATLLNLHNLLHARLTIPGWPPSPTESLELAQELTEEVDQQLYSSVSLDKGLDQLVPSEKGIENTWLRSSFSDLEWAGGNNAVPSGEVQHGKAQTRFLNGWRKKTYESEEIDPRWLTNSLNLEFDAGRRLSASSNSSPFSGIIRPPLLLVSDEGKTTRRRRFGRVEQFPFPYRDSAKGKSPDPPLITTSEPNENLSQIEHEITKLERRRSICGGGVGTNSTNSPTELYESPVDEHNLSSLTLPLSGDDSSILDLDSEDMTSVPDLLSEDDGTRSDLQRTESVNEFDANKSELVVNSYLELEPIYDPSSDERGRTPSPSFIRKLTMNGQEVMNPGFSSSNLMSSTPTHKLSLDIFPFCMDDGLEFNPLNLPVDNQPTFESSYKIQVPILGSDGTIIESGRDEKETVGVVVENFESESRLEQGSSSSDYEDYGNNDFEHESLWLRTAALLNPQSFNLIKRRISESN